MDYTLEPIEESYTLEPVDEAPRQPTRTEVLDAIKATKQNLSDINATSAVMNAAEQVKHAEVLDALNQYGETKRAVDLAGGMPEVEPGTFDKLSTGYAEGMTDNPEDAQTKARVFAALGLSFPAIPVAGLAALTPSAPTETYGERMSDEVPSEMTRADKIISTIGQMPGKLLKTENQKREYEYLTSPFGVFPMAGRGLKAINELLATLSSSPSETYAERMGGDVPASQLAWNRAARIATGEEEQGSNILSPILGTLGETSAVFGLFSIPKIFLNSLPVRMILNRERGLAVARPRESDIMREWHDLRIEKENDIINKKITPEQFLDEVEARLAEKFSGTALSLKNRNAMLKSMREQPEARFDEPPYDWGKPGETDFEAVKADYDAASAARKEEAPVQQARRGANGEIIIDEPGIPDYLKESLAEGNVSELKTYRENADIIGLTPEHLKLINEHPSVIEADSNAVSDGVMAAVEEYEAGNMSDDNLIDTIGNKLNVANSIRGPVWNKDIPIGPAQEAVAKGPDIRIQQLLAKYENERQYTQMAADHGVVYNGPWERTGQEPLHMFTDQEGTAIGVPTTFTLEPGETLTQAIQRKIKQRDEAEAGTMAPWDRHLKEGVIPGIKELHEQVKNLYALHDNLTKSGVVTQPINIVYAPDPLEGEIIKAHGMEVTLGEDGALYANNPEHQEFLKKYNPDKYDNKESKEGLYFDFKRNPQNEHNRFFIRGAHVPGAPRGGSAGRDEIRLYSRATPKDGPHEFGHWLISQGIIPRDEKISEEEQAELIADAIEAGKLHESIAEGKKLAIRPENKAIAKYGTTTVPESAAYITSDGRIIDSSGKKLGSSSEGRNIDHREIATYALPDKIKKEGISGGEAMNEFMRLTKAVRVNVSPEEISIDTSAKPNDAQLRVLGTLAKGKLIYADVQGGGSGQFKTFGEYKAFLEEKYETVSGAGKEVKVPGKDTGKLVVRAEALSKDETAHKKFYDDIFDLMKKRLDEPSKFAIREEKGKNEGVPEQFRDKTITLTHWSHVDGLKSIDPLKHGTGQAGAELKRKGPDYLPRSYHGVPPYKREYRLGRSRYESRVDGNKIYDLEADPLNLIPLAQEDKYTKYENAIKKAGFDGYWSKSYNAIAMFVPVDVKQVEAGDESLPLEDKKYAIGEDKKRTQFAEPITKELVLSKPRRMLSSITSEGTSWPEMIPLLKQYGWSDEKIAETSKIKIKNLLKAFDETPPDVVLETLAKLGEPGAKWYTRAAMMLQDFFGPDAPTVARLIAATSPQNTVLENLNIAFEAFGKFKKLAFDPWGKKKEVYRDDVEKAFKDLPTTSVNIENAVRAVMGEELGAEEGAFKIKNFAKNLMDILDGVTLDVWMAMLGDNYITPPGEMGAKQFFVRNDPRYAAYAAKVTRVANKLGWAPAEVQAAVWMFTKSLFEAMGTHNAEGYYLKHQPTERGWKEALARMDEGHIVNGSDIVNIILEDLRNDGKLTEALGKLGITRDVIQNLRPLHSETPDRKITEGLGQSDRRVVEGVGRKLADIRRQRDRETMSREELVKRQEKTKSGFIFSSGNIKEGGQLADALKEMTGSTSFEKTVEDILKDTEHASLRSIGNWEGGAEKSVSSEIYAELDPEKLRYLAAKIGLAGIQKSVLTFTPGKGKDKLYTMDLPVKDINDLTQVLFANKIENHTIIPRKDGNYQVIVFDPGGKLEKNVNEVGKHYKIVRTKYNGQEVSTIETHKGKGEFIGADTRAAAAKVFKDITTLYEERHGEEGDISFSIQEGKKVGIREDTDYESEIRKAPLKHIALDFKEHLAGYMSAASDADHVISKALEGKKLDPREKKLIQDAISRGVEMYYDDLKKLPLDPEDIKKAEDSVKTATDALLNKYYTDKAVRDAERIKVDQETEVTISNYDLKNLKKDVRANSAQLEKAKLDLIDAQQRVKDLVTEGRKDANALKKAEQIKATEIRNLERTIDRLTAEESPEYIPVKTLIRSLTGQAKLGDTIEVQEYAALTSQIALEAAAARKAFSVGDKEATTRARARHKMMVWEMRERRKESAEIAKMVKHMKAIKTDKMAPQYAEEVKKLLAPFDMTTMTSKTELKLRALRQELQDNPDADVPERMLEALDRLDKTSVRTLNIDDMHILHDAVMHYAVLGKRVVSMIGAQKTIARDMVLNQSLQEMRPPKELGKDLIDITYSKGRSFKGAMLGLRTQFGIHQIAWDALVESVTGMNSLYYKIMYRDIKDGIKKRDQIKFDLEDAFLAATEKFAEDHGIKDFASWLDEAQDIQIPGTMLRMNRNQKLSFYRGYQDPDWKRSVEEGGFGLWADPHKSNPNRVYELKEEGYKAIIDSMTQAEKDFADIAVPNIVKSGKLLQDKFLEINGYAMPMPDSGIYWRKDVMATERGGDEEKELDKQRFSRPGVFKGMTKERTASSKAVWLKPFTVALGELQKRAADYVGLEEAMSNAAWLHYKSRGAFEERYGQPLWKEIEKGLKDVSEVYPMEMETYTDGLFRKLRNATTVYALGANVGTMIKQLNGPLNYMVYVGPRYVVWALIKYIQNPRAARKMHRAMSLQYRKRSEEGYQYDVAQVLSGLNRYGQKPGVISRVGAGSMAPLRQVDLFGVDVGMLASVEEALNGFKEGMKPLMKQALDVTDEQVKGMSHGERMKLAYEWADWTTERSQPQQVPEHQSGWQRGTELEKQSYRFFGETSKNVSGIYRAWLSMERGDPRSTALMLRTLFFYIIVGSIVTDLGVNTLRALWRGQKPDYLWAGIIKGLAGHIPIVRDVVQAGVDKMQGKYFPGGGDTPFALVQSAVEKPLDGIVKAYNAKTYKQKKEAAIKIADATANLLSMGMGLPYPALKEPWRIYNREETIRKQKK
jgi:hypothetical protein